MAIDDFAVGTVIGVLTNWMGYIIALGTALAGFTSFSRVWVLDWIRIGWRMISITGISYVLRSTIGYDLLRHNQHFATQSLRKDWIRLVELLLEWETFLNEREMDVELVERLEQKHRFIMYLIKKVLRRTEGMGFKVMKYHTIIHMANDILL